MVFLSKFALLVYAVRSASVADDLSTSSTIAHKCDAATNTETSSCAAHSSSSGSGAGRKRRKPPAALVMLQGSQTVAKSPSTLAAVNDLEALRKQAATLDDAADRDPSVLLLADSQPDSEKEHSMLLNHIGHVQSICRLADGNGDERLSAEELTEFAKVLKDAERGTVTRKSWEVIAGMDGTHIALQDLVDKLPLSSSSLETLRQNRFNAADRNEDGRLSRDEYHAYANPVLDERVFAVERDFVFAQFDTDGSGGVDFEEFLHEGRQRSLQRDGGGADGADGANFSEEDAGRDFIVHDADSDGVLSLQEFAALLQGHESLADSIREVIASADRDGDAQIHLSEVPDAIHQLLDSEYVEDYFFHRNLKSEL